MHYLKYLHPFLAISVIIFLTTCTHNRKSDWTEIEGAVWNTTYHITYDGPEALKNGIIATLNRVGKSLSCFDSTSLVSKVNMHDTTHVDTDFIRVYVMSRKINKLTAGAFDPTLSPIINAWGFGTGHRPTNDTLRIDSLLEITGISKTRLYKDALIKEKPEIQFNFSAIAKGYGCDAIGEMFEHEGVKNYLIEIGGEIFAKGRNPERGNWKISIDKPISGNKTLEHHPQMVVSFTDMGMATSGNYRNTQSIKGNTYGHTISSKTGRPIQTDILSATVLSKTAMEADGLATAFMAMGKANAVKLIEKMNMNAMLILSDSSIWYSKEFEKLIIEKR